MSSRTPAPVNLKDRIAALEQRNATQKSNSSSTSLNPSGAPPSSLRDKIAKFEKKGGVPVPRGSFGLGAPPPVENAPAKRRGELYGNRIPTPHLKSHHTGNGMMGSGLPLNTSRPTSPFGAPLPNKRMSMSGLDFDKYQGVEFSVPGGGMDTGSGQSTPALPLSATSTGTSSTPGFLEQTRPFTPTEDIDTYLQMRKEAKANQQKTNFATAMDAAKKAEAEGKGIYQYHSRESSMSPESRKRYSTFVDDGESPVILVSESGEGQGQGQQGSLAQEPAEMSLVEAQDVSNSSISTADTGVEPQSQINEQSPKDAQAIKENHSDMPVSSPSPSPSSSSSISLSTTNDANAHVQQSAGPKKEAQAEETEDQTTPRASALSASSSQGPASVAETAEITITSSEQMPLSAGTGKRTSFPPETPISATPSRVRDSFISSKASSIIDASPGHITFAHRISPITGKAIYIPPKGSDAAAAGRAGASTTTESKDSKPSVNPSKAAPTSTPRNSSDADEGQLAQVDEFGVVTIIGPVPSRTKQPVARSFSAVVHSNVSPSSYPAVSAAGGNVHKSNTLPRTPARGNNHSKVDSTPMSPGLDLATLLQTSALLEERLMAGDIPSEVGRMADVEAAREVGEELRALEQKEHQRERKEGKDKAARDAKRELAHNRERKKSTVSTKSTDTIRKKMSFKSLGKKFSSRVGGGGQKGDVFGELVMPNGNGNPSASRKGSAATLTASNMASASTPALLDTNVPSVEITNPTPTTHLPPSRDLDGNKSSTSFDLSSSTSSIPPTPPPKSPSYLATLKRLASTSKNRAARMSRSFSTSEYTPGYGSVDDSGVAGVSPPDSGSTNGSGAGNEFNFNFAGNRRSGFIGPKGGSTTSIRSGSSSFKGVTGGLGRMLSRKSQSGHSMVESDEESREFSGIPDLGLSAPAPSLHELILSADSQLPVPVIQEPSELPYISSPPSSFTTPPRKNSTSSSTSAPFSPESGSATNTSRASWMSGNSLHSLNTSTSTSASPLFDKEFFDSFPSVPQTTVPFDLDKRTGLQV